MEELKESWKPIDGYEGLYEVSSQGRVYSIRTNQYLKPAETGEKHIPGHLIVCLRKDGKMKCIGVHRLVASAFVPNPKEYPIVNHIDGNKQNNKVENLEWCTQKENVAHALREGLRQKSRLAREERARKEGYIK